MKSRNESNAKQKVTHGPKLVLLLLLLLLVVVAVAVAVAVVQNQVIRKGAQVNHAQKTQKYRAEARPE